MRDVAIVGFTQSPHVRRLEERNEVELIQPVIQELIANLGVDRHAFDFVCSGSSDYLAGQAFSFVMTLDAVGPWPPISESHVEMDGAWALWEAFIKIQSGAADTALVYSYGKASPGNLPQVLTRTLDPYYLGPLWPSSVELAALQARMCIDGGVTSEADMAEIASLTRRNALTNPFAQVALDRSADDLLGASYLADPLRVSDCPPISDGGVAIALAAGDRAKELCARPAWIRGLDHRIDGASPTTRDITSAPSAKLAAQRAGLGSDKLDVAELHAPFTHQHRILTRELGLDDAIVNPSGGALAANPIMAAGLIRLGEVAARIHRGEVDRGLAHATGGQLLQHNLVAIMEGE
jgi:acetyl-CoA acetyltransferase